MEGPKAWMSPRNSRGRHLSLRLWSLYQLECPVPACTPPGCPHTPGSGMAGTPDWPACRLLSAEGADWRAWPSGVLLLVGTVHPGHLLPWAVGRERGLSTAQLGSRPLGSGEWP